MADRPDGKVDCYVSPHFVGRQKGYSPVYLVEDIHTASEHQSSSDTSSHHAYKIYKIMNKTTSISIIGNIDVRFNLQMLHN